VGGWLDGRSCSGSAVHMINPSLLPIFQSCVQSACRGGRVCAATYVPHSTWLVVQLCQPHREKRARVRAGGVVLQWPRGWRLTTAHLSCVYSWSHFTKCRKPTVFNHAHQHHHRNLLTPHIIVCPIHAHRYTHLRDSATAHVRRDSMMCRTPSSRPPANLLHEAQLMTAWVPMRAISLRIYRQKMGKFATSCQSYL
jgi:hypothetical protein